MANNVRFRQIKAFLLATQADSFAAAAARLYVSPPSFSDLIRDLEDELGVRLFERTTRKMSLTSAGVEFLGRIQRPILDIEEAYEHMRDVKLARRGLVVLGALPSVALSLLPRVLCALREQRPGLQVRVIEVHNESLLDMLRMNAVEVGLGTLLHPTEDLRLQPLLEDRFVIVGSAQGTPGLPASMTWAELAQHDVILTSLGSTPREHVEKAFKALSRPARPAYEVTHISTALSMVRQGLGLAVLPRIALYALPTSDLRLITLDEPTAVRTLGVLQRTDRQLSPASAVFIETLTQVARTLEVGRAAR